MSTLKKKNPHRNYLQLFKGQANQQDFLQKQMATKPENYYEVIENYKKTRGPHQ